MAELPSEIMFEILSRTCVKSLARFRCVSKLCCEYIDDHKHFATIHGKRSKEEPKPIIMFIQKPNFLRIRSLPIHESIDCITLLAEKKPLVRFGINPRTVIQGCCNGWVYISLIYNHMKFTSVVMVNPLRKECYKLPPMMHPIPSMDSYGLGFDVSTNTLKMVCILNQNYNGTIDDKKKHLYTMVYVLGSASSSWQEIPQIPSYQVIGKAVFAHGYLYWPSCDGDLEKGILDVKRVIWFDVCKEEFGWVDIPEKMEMERYEEINYQLFDLHGEVGLMYHYVNRRVELRVLKQKKEWVMLELYGFLSEQFIGVLGCFNKDGDILIETGDGYRREFRLLIYRLKSDVIDSANIFDWSESKVFMYPWTLSSIRPINI